MALIKCKECGADISEHAKKCPKCGASVHTTVSMKKFHKSKATIWIGVILLSILSTLFVIFFLNRTTDSDDTISKTEISTETNAEPITDVNRLELRGSVKKVIIRGYPRSLFSRLYCMEAVSLYNEGLQDSLSLAFDENGSLIWEDIKHTGFPNNAKPQINKDESNNWISITDGVETEMPKILSFKWDGNSLVRSTSVEYCNIDVPYDSYNEAEYDLDGRLSAVKLAYSYNPKTNDRLFYESSKIEYLDFDKYGNWTRRSITLCLDDGKPDTYTWIENREIYYY